MEIGLLSFFFLLCTFSMGSLYLGYKTQIMALMFYFNRLACSDAEEHERFGTRLGLYPALWGTLGQVLGTGKLRGVPWDGALQGGTGVRCTWRPWQVACSRPSYRLRSVSSEPGAHPSTCVHLWGCGWGLKIYVGIITHLPQILNWASF